MLAPATPAAAPLLGGAQQGVLQSSAARVALAVAAACLGTVALFSASGASPFFGSDDLTLTAAEKQMVMLPQTQKSRLTHSEHTDATEAQMMADAHKRWDVMPNHAFEAQPGGLLTEGAKYGSNYANVQTGIKSAGECADIASDMAMSMWVFTPDGKCSVATRLPLGGHPQPGATSGKSKWTPNFTPDGMFSYTEVTGIIAETSLLRFNGVKYAMESFGDTEFGTQFRIRKFSTGEVMANVTAAGGHSFFSAQVDQAHGKVWVFGVAHNRHGHAGDAKFPKNKWNKCDNGPEHVGCYIGAWSTTDMIHWSQTAKAVPLPAGSTIGNNAVAMVSGDNYDTSKLPKHQAIMALEMADCAGAYPQCMQTKEKFCFAVNTGSDGDLSKNWKVLGAEHCSQIHSCPSINFDQETGFYYMTGGGSTIGGPDRSRDLSHWERSPLHPVSRPSVERVTPNDNKIAPGIYTSLWGSAAPDVLAKSRENLAHEQTWNWGHSDAELCCNDGQSPSHIVYINSAQGHPKRNTLTGGKQWSDINFNYYGIGTFDGTLNEWLRSYFPEPGATYCGDMVNLCGDNPEAVARNLANVAKKMLVAEAKQAGGIDPYGHNGLQDAALQHQTQLQQEEEPVWDAKPWHPMGKGKVKKVKKNHHKKSKKQPL